MTNNCPKSILLENMMLYLCNKFPKKASTSQKSVTILLVSSVSLFHTLSSTGSSPFLVGGNVKSLLLACGNQAAVTDVWNTDTFFRKRFQKYNTPTFYKTNKCLFHSKSLSLVWDAFVISITFCVGIFPLVIS